MSKHTGSIDSLVLRRIHRMKPGAVFTPSHLAEMGSRTAVASALSRQVKAGWIRRVSRGLYQVPKVHPVLGVLHPTPEQIATALAGAHRVKLQPSGAYAANLLGLSEQVPLRIVFLTDGTPRKVRVGKQTIIVRRTTPKNMATAGRLSGLVIQALRYLGKKHIDRPAIDRLRKRIDPRERAQLRKDAGLAPAWIAEVMHQIADGSER